MDKEKMNNDKDCRGFRRGLALLNLKCKICNLKSLAIHPYEKR